MIKVCTFATAFESETHERNEILTQSVSPMSFYGRFAEYLTLHVARERERGWTRYWICFRPPLKNFSEKKLSEKFGGYENLAYLCNRFQHKI